MSISLSPFFSRIFYRCVDWNSWPCTLKLIISSRIFYRCVDWNQTRINREKTGSSRIFYRCVDWNQAWQLYSIVRSVASFTDAWIETYQNHFKWYRYYVASFTDAWIETDAFKTAAQMVNVASFTDAWIETKRGTTTRDIGRSHLLQMRGLKL